MRYLSPATIIALALASDAGAAPQTDLYVKSLTVAPGAGQVTYTVEVCNSGGSASGFELALYEDRATQPGCSDPPDHSLTITSLAMNACTSKAFVRSTPLPLGSYLAWAFVDSGCTVGEGTAGEENNFLSQPYTVGSPPDGGLADWGGDMKPPQPDGAPDQGTLDAPPPDTAPLYDTITATDAGVDSQAPPDGDDGGCSCELGSRSPAPPLLALALLLALRRRAPRF